MKLSCEQIKNQNWCEEQYLVKSKSIHQIRKETGLGINTIKRWFYKFGIPIRKIDDSIVCQQKSHKLRNHPQWKGKKNNCGYFYIYNPSHPNAPKSGYISEHRFIAEQLIGRVLNIDEFVHHIDMDKSNNELSNLHITKQRGHKHVHSSFNRLCKQLLGKNIIYFDRENECYGFNG